MALSDPKVNHEVFGGQFERNPKRRAVPQSPIRRKLPTGRELLDRIQEGQTEAAPTEYVATVRQKVAENCEELLEMGARIRPLLDGDKQVGWIRGVHASERKQLRRWLKDPDDFIFNMLLLGTSYTPEEIELMSAPEVYGLVEAIRKMTEYDMSLFPYLSAFTSTQMSENLWLARGRSSPVTKTASWRCLTARRLGSQPHPITCGSGRASARTASRRRSGWMRTGMLY